MEGLTAFVSRFDKGKREKQPGEREATTDKSRTDNMPSTSSTAGSLSFSIAEILSDKRNLNEPQRTIPTEDVENKLYGYTLQGKKTSISRRNSIKINRLIFL